MGFSRQEYWSGVPLPSLKLTHSKLQIPGFYLRILSQLLVAQLVKNLPTMQKTQFLSLGWEDPLEKGLAAHSNILAWKIPWTEEPGRLQSLGLQKVGHDSTALLSLFTFIA